MIVRPWLSFLLGLHQDVYAGHANSFADLQRREIPHHKPREPASSPATSVWSHYDTISGQNFFDSFVFINRWDNTTHSAAYYVDKETAQKNSLVYVDEHARAIIAVDASVDISKDLMPAVILNTVDGTFKYNQTALRKSVRLESLERHDAGTLVIADFQHAPFGCATWPAFWMYGPDWPKNGEIDIFEGWNDNTHGRATLHSTPNCGHDPTGIQTGKILQETCDTSVNYNAGCGVEDPTTDFYGAQFNKNGGGVFAAMYTNSEISVWRWRREDVPDDIKKSKPKPQSWPTPVATWRNGQSCNLGAKFGPQNLVFTIAMCGDSDLNTYSQGRCPGTCWDYFLKGSA